MPRAKIVSYLLSTSHPGGRGKAAFFKRFGFSPDAWQALAEALRQHADEHDVSNVEETPFGRRFVIEGPLRAPDGRSPNVRTVWFVEEGETVPRFVTAYPMRKSRGAR